jgi:hypothetical protein
MAYTGSFVGGVISGLGVYLYPDGSKYVGNSLNGKYEGHGEYYSANGNYYVGNFNNGSYNRLGEFTYANGDKYIGEFKDGLRNGQGTYIFTSGDKYVGEWRDDNKNGQGAFTFKNGIKQEGAYENGLYIGEKKAVVVQNNQKNATNEKKDELSKEAFYSILADAFEYGNKQIASKSPFESNSSTSNSKQSSSTSEKKCSYCWKRQKQIRRFDLAKDIYVWDRGDAEMRPGSILCTDQCGGSGNIVEGAFSSKSLRVCNTCKGSGWIKCNNCKGTGFNK